MSKTNDKEVKRKFRHQRIRAKVVGSAEKPRLCLHRSLKNMSAQIVNDGNSKVLFGLSTLSKTVKASVKSGGNVDGATKFGEIFAAEAIKEGFKKVCFDRGGYLYHGRIKAFAEAARNQGMEF
ncbi:MAG: 50S ribosomal protein L18 [Candidatus Omnitrophica bacterium]|nr:50S ribosomal protein L18 [Candidatus Omnitrophota bacterium]